LLEPQLQERTMICSKAPAEVGRWYLRWDRNEIFQVTGLDPSTGTIRIQAFDGATDSLSQDTWSGLQLGIADPPCDWTGPLETVDEIDLDRAEPPHPGRAG
jgi:hypothetical protein